MHIKTVILLGNCLVVFNKFVNLSTTLFIQRSLTCFYFFHKKRVLTDFYSWAQRLFTSMAETNISLCMKRSGEQRDVESAHLRPYKGAYCYTTSCRRAVYMYVFLLI